MKKIVIFLIPLIVSIPAFSEEKSLLTENFSLTKYSNNNHGVFHLDTAYPVYYLFGTEKECHSNQHQSLQMSEFKQLSELVYFSMDNVIERNKQKRKKPPLQTKRIGGEILAGGGLGIVGAIGLGAAGLGIGALLGGDDGESAMIVGSAIGAGLGYSIGSGLGVYIFGDNDDETGSIGAALLGSFLGTGLSFLGSITIGDEVPDVIYFIPVPPIIACIAFNITRRYKSKPAPDSALLNLREGKIILGIPKVYFYPDPYGRRTVNINTVLMSVEF